MSENPYHKSVLPSGLTVLTEPMPDRQSVSVGVWVRNGARDEPGDVLGVSHFIEHMMFKGTERRDARAIAASLESLGGHLDAFTAREQVCYYARSLSAHLPVVVDVLADIVCRSRFAEPEVLRERSVVKEEIFAAEDDPEDKINEILCDAIWGGHSLGLPILGTPETLERIGPDALRGYFRSRYRPEHLIVAAAGGIEHPQLIDLVGEHFAAPDGEAQPLSAGPDGYRATVRHDVRTDLQQLYLSIGSRGAASESADRYPLIVLNTLLGGGMSSRLFQSVREEAGLAYSIYSSCDFYRDAGMISIHLGVTPERGREALARVRDELLALTGNGPGAEEIAAARSQLIGSILIGQESVSNRMSHLAHEELYSRVYNAPEEQVAHIANVTDEQVVDAARRYLKPERYTLIALGPASGDPLNERDWPVETTVEVSV